MSLIPSCLLKNTYEYPLEGSGVILQIPVNYQHFSTNEYIELMQQTDLDEDIKTQEIESIKSLASLQRVPYFVDTLNTQNIIWVLQNPRYVPLDKLSIDIGMEYLKDIMRGQSTRVIEKHVIKEKKLSHLDHFSYFKLKIEQEGSFGKRGHHATRLLNYYTISTEHFNSFSIVSLNSEDEDFEKFIRQIQVRVPE